MRSHVTRSMSTCFSVLRKLRTIHRSVPRSDIQSVRPTSHVLSRLVYGNSTLAGIPNIFFGGSSLLWMQQLDSSTRRLGVATSLHFFVNSTGWKQKADRLQARCSCIQMHAPDCAAISYRWTYSPFADSHARCRLRSASSSSLAVRRTRQSTVGDRSFPVANIRPTGNSVPLPAILVQTRHRPINETRFCRSVIKPRCILQTEL